MAVAMDLSDIMPDPSVLRIAVLLASGFFLGVVGMGWGVVRAWRIPLRGTACFGLRPEPAAQSRPSATPALRGGR